MVSKDGNRSLSKIVFNSLVSVSYFSVINLCSCCHFFYFIRWQQKFYVLIWRRYLMISEFYLESKAIIESSVINSISVSVIQDRSHSRKIKVTVSTIDKLDKTILFLIKVYVIWYAVKGNFERRFNAAGNIRIHSGNFWKMQMNEAIWIQVVIAVWGCMYTPVSTVSFFPSVSLYNL